jgi:hypothetical protein
VRNPFARGDRVPVEVVQRGGLRSGEVRAHAQAADGTWLLGTREALVVVGAETATIPWQEVGTADWDSDEEQLRVAEVGEFGQARPVHVFTLPDPVRLLQMIRERVTASVLMQRRVLVDGKRGLTVVARRAPGGDGEMTWAYEFDPGVEPTDPGVSEAAAAGLKAAREEVGLGGEPI